MQRPRARGFARRSGSQTGRGTTIRREQGSIVSASANSASWFQQTPAHTGRLTVGAVHTIWGGGAGSQFFSVPGVRSDAYRVSANDDRRRNGENWPRPGG